MIDTVYFKQAELLLRIIPLIDREAVFALKGGTAISLRFLQNVKSFRKMNCMQGKYVLPWIASIRGTYSMS